MGRRVYQSSAPGTGQGPRNKPHPPRGAEKPRRLNGKEAGRNVVLGCKKECVGFLEGLAGEAWECKGQHVEDDKSSMTLTKLYFFHLHHGLRRCINRQNAIVLEGVRGSDG